MTAQRTANRRPTSSSTAVVQSDDAALDEALAHIAALSGRLLVLQRLHRAGRGLRRGWCRDCGQRYPCPTLRFATGQGCGAPLRDWADARRTL
jgi:hypothetical protein